jgi:hypothetical protein
VVFWLGNNGRLAGMVRYGVFVAVVAGAITLIGGWVLRIESARAGADAG